MKPKTMMTMRSDMYIAQIIENEDDDADDNVNNESND